VLTMSFQKQFTPGEGLLESRAHEMIACSRMRENLEMDPKEERIDDEGNKDQAKSSRKEMSHNVFLK
jgi:hypothetical protein